MNNDPVDPLDRVRHALGELPQRAVVEHVGALSQCLDAIVNELDDLARSIPPAR